MAVGGVIALWRLLEVFCLGVEIKRSLTNGLEVDCARNVLLVRMTVEMLVSNGIADLHPT